MRFDDRFNLRTVAAAHVDYQRNSTMVTTRDYSNITFFTAVERESHAPEFVAFKNIYTALKENQFRMYFFEELV